MNDLFAREQSIHNGAVGALSSGAEPDREAYGALANEYGRLLRQLRRVTRLSDRTAEDLNASKLNLLDGLLRMSSLAESSPNFISYKKLTGECVYLNPAASVLTGYSHDELMRDYIGLLYDEETANYLRYEIPAALANKGIINYEVTAKCKNGETRIFSACSFLVESDEKAFGTVATDITEKKRIESERLEALEKAEQASRAKSDFLSRMNHELRTPMNAIVGMAGIAQKSLEAQEMRECLVKIDAAASQLLGIIDDVLDMSKIYAGEAELAREQFQIGELLSQVSAVMKIKLDEKRQHFSVAADSDVPGIITADKQKLARIITNLLDNANKFTPDGGNIGLYVHKEEQTRERCALRFVIEDDGIGITEEQKARIWDAFEQSDNTINRRFGGVGLGLAISQRFVNLMGGEISVESKPGEGTKFAFTIEVDVASGDVELSDTDTMPSGEDNDYESEQGIFDGRRLLLADDVEINREILMALLEDTGIAISCAENGREACEIFAAGPDAYDIIMLDIHMPEMNGYEAAETIRAMKHPRAETVPIIAVTADVDIAKSTKAGMNDSVAKPLDIDAVIEKMKRYLQ